MKPQLLMIIGPTAVGKSTLLERALGDYPRLRDVITYTTRPMRQGEAEGRPYHFVSEEKFRQLIEQKFFVEWALVHDRHYGTPRDQIEQAAHDGRVSILDVDVQGAKTLRREFPQAVGVFLLPPSIDALRERFRKRGVTSEADLNRRLQSAQNEIAQAHDFDHVVLNDNLESAYSQVRKVIENLLKNQ